jgi:hypothetical protein
MLSSCSTLGGVCVCVCSINMYILVYMHTQSHIPVLSQHLVLCTSPHAVLSSWILSQTVTSFFSLAINYLVHGILL